MESNRKVIRSLEALPGEGLNYQENLAPSRTGFFLGGGLGRVGGREMERQRLSVSLGRAARQPGSKHSLAA